MKFVNDKIYIEYNNYYYQLGEIELSDDGSIYLKLISESGKLKKTSIHTSGRINYSTSDEKVIFINQIYNINKPYFICALYVPYLSKMKKYNEIKNDNNLIFSIDEETFFTIVFFINDKKIPENSIHNIFQLQILDTLFLNIEILFEKFDDRSNDNIIFYSPQHGEYSTQAIDRFTAETNFRNILFRSKNITIFGPDEKGNMLLHFSHVMRTTPFVKIEFENKDLFVNEIKGNCTKAIFNVKNRRYNRIVKKVKYLKVLKVTLDAEIYEEDYIPDGFIKIMNS